MEFFESVWQYILSMDLLEFGGFFFGAICVVFLIRENILTWPSGILYVLISFVIFWEQRLYGDLLLHIFFLVLNIYGWYYWVRGKKSEGEDLPVTATPPNLMLKLLLLSVSGIYVFGLFLESLPLMIEGLPEPSLPYWDSSTSVLSVTAMWLTARKKIENWYFWFIVDILATGIYFYKGIEFYALLYLVYIGMAVTGYLAWRRSMKIQAAN